MYGSPLYDLHRLLSWIRFTPRSLIQSSETVDQLNSQWATSTTPTRMVNLVFRKTKPIFRYVNCLTCRRTRRRLISYYLKTSADILRKRMYDICVFVGRTWICYMYMLKLFHSCFKTCKLFHHRLIYTYTFYIYYRELILNVVNLCIFQLFTFCALSETTLVFPGYVALLTSAMGLTCKQKKYRFL